MLHNFPLDIPLGPGIIHLEPADGGGAAAAIVFSTRAIPVNVEGMLWLSRYIHRLLFLLRHISANFVTVELNGYGGTVVQPPKREQRAVAR